MKPLTDHVFDNLEHGRGRRLPAYKKSKSDANTSVFRQREKRPQHKPFPYITLATALKKALAAPALKRRLNVLEIAGQWEALVGEAVADHVQPTSLEKGILLLQTDSSVWRQQISLMRMEILEKLRCQFNENVVKQIRVR